MINRPFFTSNQTVQKLRFTMNQIGMFQSVVLLTQIVKHILLSKTAEERYAKLLDLHKEYIAKIPVNKIAGYLGIHPESLSRIRKKMNS